MKTRYLALPFLATTLSGSQLTLTWDPSPTPGVTNVLYASTNAFTGPTRSNALVRLEVGTNLTASVDNILPATWYFATAASKGGVESDLSGMAVVQVPQPPANMRTIVLQYGNSVTNLSNQMYFKLGIQ